MVTIEGTIIGNGDVATALKEVHRSSRLSDHKVFLASGLSNSTNVTFADFCREKALIFRYSNNHIVYFSSLCIYYSDSPYSKYKQEIEKYIKETCKRYTIVRLGNITWGSNPNTIINYFKRNPNAKVEDGYRYLVEKDEFLHWINLIPNFNTEMNITGKLTPIKEIYDTARKG